MEYVAKEGAEETLEIAIKKAIANASDMMVDGAISGLTDSSTRAVAQGRIEDLPKDSLEGLITGTIASPLIGGAMKGAFDLSSNIIAKELDIKIEKARGKYKDNYKKLNQEQRQKCIEIALNHKELNQYWAIQLAKLNDEDLAKAWQLKELGIPDCRLADTAVCDMNVVEDLINKNVNKLYISKLAQLDEESRNIALKLMDEKKLNAPSAIYSVLGWQKENITPENMLLKTDFSKKIELDEKKVNELLQMAEKIYDENEKYSKTLGDDTFGKIIDKNNENIFSSRIKGITSIEAKLESKFESDNFKINNEPIEIGEFNGQWEDLYKEAVADVFGTRLQISTKINSKEIVEDYFSKNYPDLTYKDFENFVHDNFLTKNLDINPKDNEAFIEALDKLKEKQTEETFNNLVNKMLADENLVITEINNYGNELSSYFSDAQLTKLKNICEPRYEKFEWITKNKNKKKAVKKSGYVSCQMNIRHPLGDKIALEELQLRGTKTNILADIEHIAYDIKQGKITPKDTEYTEIYNIIKNLSNSQFDSYNQYLTQNYNRLRAIELGIIDENYPEIKIEDFIKDMPKDKLAIISQEGLLKLNEKLHNHT